MLDQVQRYFEYPGADVDHAHELYHDDAVLEFPQSGERFEGVANFTEWRRRYPAEVRYRMRRITAREDLVVVELSISYNGGPWQYECNYSSSAATRWHASGSTSWRAGRHPNGGPPGAPILRRIRRSNRSAPR
jgi:hypothetical protein